ncbi:MAG: hypothetical protein GF370_02970 [Candidatus Nealsonbacteria bacterium]|nr:hypothetical protein [Candidatus Nealsonbacteria bacterium]
MPLCLILGPMKSGKSLALINHFQELKKKGEPFQLYQPALNVRDQEICSRAGLSMRAEKIDTIRDVPISRRGVIGLDELHMFKKEDVASVKFLLSEGKSIIAAGLDKDYKGKLFLIIKGLLALEPGVTYLTTKCELCGIRDAAYSQIYRNGVPVVEGLPAVVPDDGRFTYRPVCEKCFVKK